MYPPSLEFFNVTSGKGASSLNSTQTVTTLQALVKEVVQKDMYQLNGIVKPEAADILRIIIKTKQDLWEGRGVEL